jgi:amidohydrolase
MIDFLSESKALFEYTQSLRRDFHAHPELGFQEFRTAEIVAKELTVLGLEPETGIGETGVVSLLRGNKPGAVILVRADMDALPITEETGAPYASQNPGVMHACGHDGHTATLLTVAKMLAGHRDQLSGTIKFMFQPAEEGMGGAEKMIDAGVLKNPDVDLALALHVWNEKPLGWIGISDGSAMAGAEIFKVKVQGKGGHGAVPNLAIDPILASAQIISALQGIISRNVAPLQTAVVSVCTIHGGETFNVIPPMVEMTGTIRTFEPDVREQVLERFEKIVHSVSEGMGCKSNIDLQMLTPATINTPEIARQIQSIARSLFPDAEVDSANHLTMGSEDFAYVLEKVPGCFFFIGSANPSKGLTAGHHHPKFDIDEAALTRGAALMASAILSLGERGSN